MSTMLLISHWLAGFVVLAEALNKLERTAPFSPGMCRHDRLVDGLKALAWMLLAIGAGGAVIMPVLAGLGIQAQMNQTVWHQSPSLAETSVLLGFAVLIIRTRVKEG